MMKMYEKLSSSNIKKLISLNINAEFPEPVTRRCYVKTLRYLYENTCDGVHFQGSTNLARKITCV